MPRSYYYSSVGGVVWFVAPKCGTRTTLKACNNIGFKFPENIGRNPLPDSYDFSFSFVRNPYDRLVSAHTEDG
jgi:Sulfotransferase family.